MTTSSTNDTVSEVFRALADALGHRHLDIAAKLGRSPQFISQKLTGRTGWTVRDIDQVAELYGLAAIDFFREPEAALRKLEREYAKLPVALRPSFRAPRQRGATSSQLELESVA